MQKNSIIILLFSMLVLSSGCKEIQIFEKESPSYAVEITDDELEQETFYVKNGTRFSKVYMPAGNSKNEARKLDKSRIMYMIGDEKMVPIHYKGELVAYASTKADLDYVLLERFEDIGYSIGIYGGTLKGDGYYHFSVSKNIATGSQAASLFSQVVSDEIRIISIGGVPIEQIVDKESGILLQLKKDETYIVEFYSGTYYYRQELTADTHFLKTMELYSYDRNKIDDTIYGYMCFNTPESLKSGYYNINGSGIFLYHAYKRGEEIADESLNEGYYDNIVDLVAAYSKQYTISAPNNTRNLLITVSYGSVTDDSDREVEKTGYVIAPDGTGYEMNVDAVNKKMTLALTSAMAGDWIVNISPKSLEVLNVSITSDEVKEDTTCVEQEFIIEEDMTFQQFYADIEGTGNVYGSIIGPNGITYNFSIGTYKENGKEKRYMQYKLPYVKSGTYKVKIYHYKSETSISNISMHSYENQDSDIIIIN